MASRRTTVVAEDDDLAVMADEARRQGVSLGCLLGRLVADQADRVRKGRRSQVARFRVDMSITKAMDGENPAERPFR